MIVDRDLLTHWKLKSLIQVIGRGEALTALLSLWAHCEARKAWEFKLTPLMLAGICAYEGKGRTPPEREHEASTLFATLLTLAFIEKAEEDGWYRVHDWGERNAGLHVKWPGKHGFEWHPRGYPVKRGETSPSGAPPPPPRGAAKGAPIPPPDRIGEDRIGEEKPPVVPQGGRRARPVTSLFDPRLGDTGHAQREPGTPASKPQEAAKPEKKEGGPADGGELISAEAIYAAYPRKIGRGGALKAIAKALKESDLTAGEMLELVQKYAAATDQWAAEDREYIPHPSTWFNQQRYTDDTREWHRNNPELKGLDLGGPKKRSGGRFDQAQNTPGAVASGPPCPEWRNFASVALGLDLPETMDWERVPANRRTQILETYAEQGGPL